VNGRAIPKQDMADIDQICAGQATFIRALNSAA
jgi:hypothetical protein